MDRDYLNRNVSMGALRPEDIFDVIDKHRDEINKVKREVLRGPDYADSVSKPLIVILRNNNDVKFTLTYYDKLKQMVTSIKDIELAIIKVFGIGLHDIFVPSLTRHIIVDEILLLQTNLHEDKILQELSAHNNHLSYLGALWVPLRLQLSPFFLYDTMCIAPADVDPSVFHDINKGLFILSQLEYKRYMDLGMKDVDPLHQLMTLYFNITHNLYDIAIMEEDVNGNRRTFKGKEVLERFYKIFRCYENI